ncbi:heat shock transcription factor, X-linked member 3-like [Hipposideros larvatus]
MPLRQMSELCKLGADFQEPRENQDLLEAQLFWDMEEDVLSLSSSSSSSSLSLVFSDSPEEVAAGVTPSPPQSPPGPCPTPEVMEAPPLSESQGAGSSSQGEEQQSTTEDPEDAESCRKQAVHLMMPELRVFGVDVKQVDASDHSYVLVNSLGLTYDGVASDGHCVPKNGLLILLLCVILMEGDSAPEEKTGPMASRSSYETDEAKLAPFREGEPATGVPSDSSPDPNVDSREIQGTHGEKAMSEGPGPQDNPPPQAPNQGAANVEGNRAILGFSFPRKLRIIVEDDTFTSVRWNDDEDIVIIEKDLFQGEILSRKGAERIFETGSLKTFIRLMNHYGFSKIRPNDPSDYSPGNKRVMMYRNCNFQRDKPLLIENVKRKYNMMITACPRAAGCAMEDSSSSEPGGPSGEGTSSNTMFEPTATATRDGAGELRSRPSGYGSVMSLYHKCYSNLLAGLSVMAPHEAPEGDVEEEGSSDYKCAFFEHFKANPSP